MTKRLVRIYVSYGKGDGNEVSDQYVIEDTKENREELYENEIHSFCEILESKDDFLNGKIDCLNVILDGGDWDDPTGMAIILFDKDEMIADINSERDSEIANVERLFEKEAR